MSERESLCECACKKECGDVPEAEDHPRAICKGLPLAAIFAERLAYESDEQAEGNRV